MKIWLHTEGPVGIIESVADAGKAEAIKNTCNHICQACAYLHLDQDIRHAVQEKWQDYAPRVLGKFAHKQLSETV